MLKEVKTKKDVKTFVQFPVNLYTNSNLFVPPILKQEISTLYHAIVHQNYKIKCWLVFNHGSVAGRIAAIIIGKEPQKARFSYFDCINNQQMADELLNAATEWSKKNGASCIHGPLGNTSFDKSGILVEGFEHLPTIFSAYNFEYYQTLVENAGFIKEFDWVEYRINVPDDIPQKIKKGSGLIRKRYGLETIPANSVKKIKAYKSAILETLNCAYKGLDGFTQLSKKQFDAVYNEFSKVINPDFTAFITDKQGEMVGFGIVLPSYSKAFQKINGKLWPLGPWYIQKAKKKNDTVDLLLIAVRPEYQNKGVIALIFEKITQSFMQKKIKYIESTKELETNKKVQNLWGDYDYKQHKRSRCYIKQIN